MRERVPPDPLPKNFGCGLRPRSGVGKKGLTQASESASETCLSLFFPPEKPDGSKNTWRNAHQDY